MRLEDFSGIEGQAEDGVAVGRDDVGLRFLWPSSTMESDSEILGTRRKTNFKTGKKLIRINHTRVDLRFENCASKI